jgi:hypothetical protein
MLAGVEILLERMKTNPEEFIEGGLSKWSRVIDAGWEVLGEEERNALQDAIRSAKRDRFSGEVMRVLAQGHDDKLVIVEDYDRLANTYTTNLGKSMAVTKKSMIDQTTQILRDEFDKAYAEQKGSSPYQQRK